MTKFNHYAHRELWHFLAANPMANKEDWPGWDNVEWDEVTMDTHCFACGACEDCEDCPLIWPENSLNEPWCNFDGLFTQWRHSNDPTERSMLARQIAELPVKPGIETEE